MFVIKNTQKAFDTYFSVEGKWSGLLNAKTYNSEEEAKKDLKENGKIYTWEEILNMFSKK